MAVLFPSRKLGAGGGGVKVGRSATGPNRQVRAKAGTGKRARAKRVVVISESPARMADLVEALGNGPERFRILRLGAPEFARDVVDQFHPDVVITESHYASRGAGFSGVMDDVHRLFPAMRFIVVDPDTSGTRPILGGYVVSQASAIRGDMLAQLVAQASADGRVLRYAHAG